MTTLAQLLREVASQAVAAADKLETPLADSAQTGALAAKCSWLAGALQDSEQNLATAQHAIRALQGSRDYWRALAQCRGAQITSLIANTEAQP